MYGVLLATFYRPNTNAAPVAGITQPSDGVPVVRGTLITFAGGATDVEDGFLTGASLVWTSSRDGQIGTGTTFDLATLSVGSHTITLTATDAQGAVGQASIVVPVVLSPAVLALLASDEL